MSISKKRLSDIVRRGGLFSLLVSSAIAASIPFEENFDGGTATDFTLAGTSGVYFIEADSPSGNFYEASVSSSSGDVTGSSGVVLDNAATNAFVISSKLVIVSFTSEDGSGVSAGLGLYSSTVNFSSGSQYRLIYQLSQSNAGKLQILRNGVSIGVSAATLPPRLNVPYVFQAIVTHDNGEVTIKGVISDDSDTISVTATDTAPLTGTYFGYRTAVNADSEAADLVVRYDDFDVRSSLPPSVAGDQAIGGSLFVNGSFDMKGSAFTLGSVAETYAAGLLYDNADGGELTFDLTAGGGAWKWARGGVASMRLDELNRLHLAHPEDDGIGIWLDPAGYSEFGYPVTFYGHDNRAPNQTVTDEHSVLTVALGDARYIQSDESSEPVVSALTVTGSARFDGAVRIAPQGDLGMGEFTSEPSIP